jgi:uncharacterized protein YceK
MEDTRRVTKALLGVGLSLAVAVGVSACGGTTTKTTPGNGPSSTAPGTSNGTPATTAPPSGGGVSY